MKLEFSPHLPTDFYAIADKLNVCLLGTLRDGTGPVHRAMGVAKRSGPDLLFLGNAHAQKVRGEKHIAFG
jgi:hypothetical protein